MPKATEDAVGINGGITGTNGARIWPRFTFKSMIQLRGGGEHVQDPARPGDTILDQREGEGGHEGRDAQQMDQPHQGDQLAQLNPARAQQQHPVQQRQRHRHPVGEHRQVERLNPALAQEQVAEQRRGRVEPFALPPLPHRGLDQFDARDRLFRGGGDPTVLGALLHQHRTEAAHVVAHRRHEGQRINPGNQQQPRVEQCHVHQRRQEPQHHVRDEQDAGLDHVAEMLGIVGGTRYQIADPLAVVESLALAEQAAVQLVAGVALQPTAQGERAHARGEPEQLVAQQDEQQRRRRPEQGGGAVAVEYHLRYPAHHDRTETEQRPGHDIARDGGSEQQGIAA